MPEADRLRQAKTEYEFNMKDAGFKEKEIRQRNYFGQEVSQLKTNLDEIGKRKIGNILRTGCEIVVTGNIGCLVQLRSQLQRARTIRSGSS